MTSFPAALRAWVEQEIHESLGDKGWQEFVDKLVVFATEWEKEHPAPIGYVYIDEYQDLEEQVAALTAERDVLKADVQHLLDTCVPVAELDDLKAQLAAGDAARAALRDALEQLMYRIENSQRCSIGSIDNVRRCDFSLDDIERLRKLLASSPPERTT